MFEQAVLRPAPVRGWAVTLSFVGELALLGCILAVPLIWPQLLSRREVMAWITAPLPPPPLLQEVTMPHVRPTRPWIRPGAIWLQPVVIPATTPVLDEPPAEMPGAVGGRESGPNISAVLDSVARVDAPKRPAEPAPPPVPKAASAPVQQIRVSGTFESARLIHRVEPVYPMPARQARIAGTVELAGVIGIDGHIRELRVVSGHPFLVRSALEAVQQWIYEPTSLSGKPVEVITTINVIFRLN